MNILITGASKGIGLAAAKLFLQKGDHVAALYHTTPLPKDIQSEAFPVKCDITDTKQVQLMKQAVLDRFGDIDVLVNNAGIAEQKLFTDITETDWDNMFNVNIKGMYLCTQAVLPNMIHRKSGKIINLSSIWGITGASCEVHYSASKAAVIGFTKALAKELGPSHIQVNCIAPGVIDTDMNSHLTSEDRAGLCEETPLGRFGTPLEIAECIYYLASSSSDFMTGQVISPNGGIVI